MRKRTSALILALAFLASLATGIGVAATTASAQPAPNQVGSMTSYTVNAVTGVATSDTQFTMVAVSARPDGCNWTATDTVDPAFNNNGHIGRVFSNDTNRSGFEIGTDTTSSTTHHWRYNGAGHLALCGF
jgi:hypothetical protein